MQGQQMLVVNRLIATKVDYIGYHNQCISPGNMLYGTTTSPFHLAMCHAVPRPVYFTWQCVMRYHNTGINKR
jgi:hypothetical protein